MSRVLLNGVNQITGRYLSNHKGVDLVKKTNQLDTIIAHSDGVVVNVKKGLGNTPMATNTASYGNFVKIKHDNGYYTLYAHLKDVYVKETQRVKKGEKIGYMGNSGNSYGAHLHFEVRNPLDERIDPTYYLDHDLPNFNRAIKYQAYDKVKKYWLPEVIVGKDDYAGNFGNPISGIYLDYYKIRVHDLNKGYWLPWVTNRSDYAGNLNNSIDGVQIENATYRVHIKNGNWLSWVNKVDDTADGYAGIYGKEIDAIQIK